MPRDSAAHVPGANGGYEAGLLAALRHPVADHQMIAIRTLGELHSEAALPAFAELLFGESDIYVCREIVRALARINTAESRRLLERAARHRAAPVAHLARQVLAGDTTELRGDSL